MDLTMQNTVLLDIWWNMLIKFIKQISNTFVKIINGYKGEFKTLPKIRDRHFSASRYWLTRQTQNLANILRWSLLQKYSKTKSYHFTINEVSYQGFLQ